MGYGRKGPCSPSMCHQGTQTQSLSLRKLLRERHDRSSTFHKENGCDDGSSFFKQTYHTPFTAHELMLMLNNISASRFKPRRTLPVSL